MTQIAELGVRRDGGDSEPCNGFEGGVGFKKSNSLTRLNVSANARSPLSFESEVKQWGAGFVLRQVLEPVITGASYMVLLEHSSHRGAQSMRKFMVAPRDLGFKQEFLYKF